MARTKITAVLQGVNRDLRAMDERKPGVSNSALAESARELARQMGQPDNSATSKALCARALQEQLEALEASLPPAKKEADGIDQLEAQRQRRRGSAA